MLKNGFLSICISTYNRKEDVIQLVTNILKCKNADLRVEVSDNASSDGTFDALKEINDNRLLFSQNKKNLGIYNMMRMICDSRSKYCFICNDRDFVDYTKLDVLINKLKEEEKKRSIALVYIARYAPVWEHPHEITWLSGVDALCVENLYEAHPTGRIVNKDFFVQTYDDSSIDIFKADKPRAIYVDILAYGDYGIYDEEVCQIAGVSYLAKHPSGSTCGLHGGDVTKIYFHPVYNSLRMEKIQEAVILNSNMAKNFTQTDRERIFKAITLYCLKSVPLYKNFQNFGMCEHYGIKPRYIPLHKMVGAYNMFHQRALDGITRCELSNDFRKWWKKQYLKNLVYIIKRSIKRDYFDLKYILYGRHKSKKRFMA